MATRHLKPASCFCHRLRTPFGIKGKPLRCEMFDLEGNSMGEAEIRLTEDYLWVLGKPGGHRYLLPFGER